ncbi:MAG TPA: serine protease [Rhizomicrobium sp.]|jgi:Trypsin-like peptidase domain|nr:serine protease [Rhizomicrobium sp.]
MPLKITYKSPPYRDKVLSFEDTLEEIRIGRTPGSEVEYPEDMAVVGHDHFAIVRQAGTYKFVINPHHRVFAGGRDVMDGEELASTTEVRLGTVDGPRLLLEPSRTSGTAYVATEAQGRSAVLPDIARAGLRWTHVLGVVVALVILGGAFAYWKLSGEVQPIYANAGAGTDFSSLIAKYQKSVFLVDEVDAGGNSQTGATAWVVALPDGRKAFATNAHVGGLLADARKNHYRLLVRSPEAAHREYEIVDAIIHPAYAAFEAMLAEADKRASAGMIREVGLSPAYDVAILIPDKQDGLPPALPLASDKSLSTLHAGEPIAFIGYPAENLVSFDTNAPTPTSQVGIITSVRNFFLTEEGGPAQLIEHSLPSAGGASGSPIFDQNGEVIALLSGGNNIASKDGRIPNAALVNFAQRVDLLRDLVENKAKDQLDADKRMWAEGVARWSRSPESIAAVYARQFEATEGKLANITRDGTTGAADPLFEHRSARSFDLSLLGDKNYLVTAYTPAKSPLRVVVYNADDPSSILDTTVFITDGPLTVLEIPAGSPGTVKIAVISEAGPQGHPDTSPVPFKLAVYWPLGKPPAGSGQESGQSPRGGTTSPSAPPSAPPNGNAPSGGDEGGGDVGQTP